MMKKKGLILLVILIIGGIIYFISSSKTPYTISEDNVKLIYCEYYLESTKILPVSVLDKKTIISELSKMREVKTSGQVGTVPYKFIIELTNGYKIEFIQNTGDVIELYSDIDKRLRKIKAPKTAEFIKKLMIIYNPQKVP